MLKPLGLLIAAAGLSSLAVWAQQARAPITTLQFGLPGDVPVAGDYDGDGLVDIAVFRPALGVWLISPAHPFAPRPPALQGLPGRDGKDGQDGQDGQDGKPGEDGRDAVVAAAETESFAILAPVDNLTLAKLPLPRTVRCYKNGMRLSEGYDYQVAGSVVTFGVNAPQASDLFTCDYSAAGH